MNAPVKIPGKISAASTIGAVGSGNALATGTQKFFQFTFFMPIVGLLGGGLRSLGKWMNVGGLEKAGDKIAHFNDVVQTKAINELAGDTAIGKTISNTSKTIAEKAGNLLGGMDKGGRIIGWLKGSQQSDINAHIGVLEKLVGELKASMTNKKNGNIFGDAHTTVLEQVNGLESLLKNAKDGDALKAAQAEITNIISGLQETAKDMKNVGTFTGKLKDIETRQSLLGKVLDTDIGNNLGDYIKKIPDRIGKMSAHDIAFQTANVAMYAGEVYGMAKDFSSNMKVMKAMYKDMTGKEASSFKIMFGDVPAPVKMMRKQYMTKNIFSNILNFGGFVAGQVAFNRGNKMGWGLGKTFGIGLGASMGTSMLTSFLIKPTDVGQTYATIASAQAKGVSVPAETYATLFASLAPVVGKTGKIAGNNVMDLANACAANNADLGTALNMFEQALQGKSFKSAVPAISMEEAQRTTQMQQQPGQLLGQYTNQYLNRSVPSALAPKF